MPCLPCGVDAGVHLAVGDSTFAYNQRLGQAHANSVRDYLVSTGGLADGQVRAASHGDARNEQVRPDAIGDEGRDNRRVSLVVDYAGASSSMPSTMPTQEACTDAGAPAAARA